jgi:hypothetical protein
MAEKELAPKMPHMLFISMGHSSPDFFAPWINGHINYPQCYRCALSLSTIFLLSEVELDFPILQINKIKNLYTHVKNAERKSQTME